LPIGHKTSHTGIQTLNVKVGQSVKRFDGAYTTLSIDKPVPDNSAPYTQGGNKSNSRYGNRFIFIH
jgi:hypothetical protein